MISGLHAMFAVAAWVILWRGVTRDAFIGRGPDPDVAASFAVAVLVASAAGSLAAIAAGRRAWSPGRALLLDAVSLAATAWAFAVISLGPWSRELGGLFAVAIVLVRLAPGALAVVTGRAPAWLAFAVALGAYAALAAWLPTASLPLGDQIHYLLVSDRLAHGHVDTPFDASAFTQILGIPPSPEDAATHVADTPLGPRPIQGYALSLLILPGWVVLGRLGAGIVVAILAAWTSLQTFLILRDLNARGALPPSHTPRGRDVSGWTWLIVSASAPMILLATHEYPNMFGAAIVATAFRLGFTAPIRRPALAAGILALTLLLTPRDAVALVVLIPFLLRDPRERRGVALASVAVLVAVAVIDGVLYGLPVPYASYFFGTLQAQELTRQGSITALLWVTLPAILFDRTFGIAGTAPWAFIGLLGLVPALAAERSRLEGTRGGTLREGYSPSRPVFMPAALAVGASVVALSFFRLWEGGYAPPARYFVDVLPLWAPFVAIGLVVALDAVAGVAAGLSAGVAEFLVRVFVALAIGMSALTSFVLSAAPALALNTAFDDKIRHAVGMILGIDPLGWLPSFQPVTPDWYVAAYLRLVPAVAGCAALVVTSRRYALLKKASAAQRDRFGAPESVETTPPLWQRNAAKWQGRTAKWQRNDAKWQRNAATFAGTSEEQLRGGPAWRARIDDPLLVFIVVNLLASALVTVATYQPWLASSTDPVPDSLYRKWLPLALGLTTLGTAFVARALPVADRGPILRRHFLVYVAPLALLLVAWASGGPVANGTLGAIYLAIPLLFALHAVAALWPHVEGITDRATAWQIAAIALVVALALLPYHRAVMPTASDEPHYLLVTQSLVYDHDLDLANDYAGDRYGSFYPSRLPDIHGVKVGDAVYSIRDLGLPILGVIPFAIAGRLGVLALLCVIGAALAAQLYLLLRDLRFAPRIAFLAAATTALVHPILTYTTQIYPELPTALAFVLAVRAIRHGQRSTPLQLATASALLGTLPWLSTRAWPIVIGAGLVVAYAALRPRRDLVTRVAAGALPFAALVLALAFLNWRTFGLFLPSAGYFLIREQQPVLTFTPLVGAPGLLFDRVFGLIPRAPVYLLAFLGIYPLLRRARTEGAELAALAAGSILSLVYIADIAYWWADGSPPSRYVLGSLPLFVAAVAGGWEIVLGDALPIALRAPVRTVTWLAVAASAAIAYVYAVLPNIRYDLALDIAATGSSGALFVFLGRIAGIDLGRAFPSLVQRDLFSIGLTVAWTVACVLLIAVGARAARGYARAA